MTGAHMLGGVLAVLWTGLAAWAAPASAQASSTLAAVKARGELVCGVAGSNPPFSAVDQAGVMRGLDADTCRAMAAAFLGDPVRAKFRVLTSQNRFTALQSGEVDVLFYGTTWTSSREMSLGLQFAGVNYFSGLGLMAKASLGVDSALKLDGATVCIPPGSTTELTVGEYFRAHAMRFTPVLIEETSQLQAAFIAGRCDVMARDTTALAGFRGAQGPRAGEYVVLPELLAMEPLGAFVRKGDPVWFDLVRWSLLALVAAEQLEVTQANVDRLPADAPPEVRRLLGRTGDMAAPVGLDAGWIAAMVRAVGNYSEVWDRSIGPTGLPRGLNNLWNRGGLLYAPPYR